MCKAHAPRHAMASTLADAGEKDGSDSAAFERKPSPELRAPFPSRLLLLWIVPMVFQGWRKPLTDADLPELKDEERGGYTTRKLRDAWVAYGKKEEEEENLEGAVGEEGQQESLRKEKKKKKKSKIGRLGHSLLDTHRRALVETGFLKAFDIVLGALQPVFVNRLLVFLRPGSTVPTRSGYLYAVLLFLMPLLKTLVENHYFLRTIRGGMRVRSAVQGVLYEKTLAMSPSARGTATVGEVVNLMQLDAQRGADFFQFIHVLWGAPVQIIVTVVLLFLFIGPSAIIGLLITLLTVPLQGWLMSYAMRLRARGVGITDQRVKMMNEVLQGIKAVKFYAWERPFAEKVAETRKEELDNFAKTIVVRSAFFTLMMVIPTLIAVITFSMFAAVFKNELKPERVFTGIALLNQLRTPVMMLPMVVNSAIDAKLAFKRLERFLTLEDIDNYAGRPDPYASDDDGAVAPGQKKITGDSAAVTATDSYSSDDVHPTPVPSESTDDGTSRRDGGQVGGVVSGAAASVTISGGQFGWGEPGEALQPRERKKSGGGPLSKCLPGKKKKAAAAAAEAEATAEAEAAAVEEAGGVEAAASIGDHGKDKVAKGPFLKDVSVNLKAGELTAVVGRVGSGKTSLVNAILGEMKKMGGSASVVGSIAYVAQSPWIFNDTLRNNVLFGNAYDEKRYRQAVHVSALEPDIAVLPSGDLTAIGEKGINLSGGQKQRVSIARAVYANTDVYVFDDPLSALDSHVGQSVFDDCISNKGVLSTRLRVFVTNQVQLLPDCDRVLFMEKGSIRCAGPYEELLEDSGFRQLVDEVGKEDEDQDLVEDAAAEATSHSNGMDAGGEGPSTSRGGVDVSATSVDDSLNTTIAAVTQAADSQAQSKDGTAAISLSKEGAGQDGGPVRKDDGKNLISTEERNTGNVLVRAYYRYAVACGGILKFSGILAVFIASVALSVIVNWWLVYWSDQSVGDTPNSRLGFFLGIYFGLGMVYAVLTFSRSVWYLTSALQASKDLHETMLRSVLHAPMSFFDTTPIGRIISRFSRDVNAVDQLLPQMFSQMLSTVLNLLASYIYIATVFPWFIIVAVPITVLYYCLQRFYNRTSIELKRLDSISKSPIYAGFSETLGGLSTIRAYNKQKQFRDDNMEKIDVNQRAYFSSIASNRWFSLYLEVCGSFLVFATALLAVITRSSSSSSAASVGLSLTYALQVTGILGFTIRSITELELQMNSVERLDHYGKKLDQEAPSVIKEGNPLSDGQVWPATGEIDIRDVKMRYRPGLDLVLKGISIKIPAGSKVGIVGRTGSGKSSLMLVLLRLVELSGGTISIDGVDVSSLGLDDVRSNITIIPQDPVLFSGTVRFNLDPFGVYTEPELWDALAKSHLKEFVETFDGGLDAQVTEYGENLSAGQKQLICLTRALLRKSKVLIMDEASSSLDYETDRLLQESIQENMGDATILTIAHRLWTLTKCDKILVMSDGVAEEFDTPEVLLANPQSQLRFLVDAMGDDAAAKFAELVDENARLVGRL